MHVLVHAYKHIGFSGYHWKPRPANHALQQFYDNHVDEKENMILPSGRRCWRRLCCVSVAVAVHTYAGTLFV